MIIHLFVALSSLCCASVQLRNLTETHVVVISSISVYSVVIPSRVRQLVLMSVLSSDSDFFSPIVLEENFVGDK